MKKSRRVENLVGTGALVFGVAVFGTVLVRSLWSSGAPVTTPDVGPLVQGVDAPADAGIAFELPPEYLRRAVSAAPFQPNREAPVERYRLPGDAPVIEMPVEVPQRELPPAPAFQVLGTAASSEGSLAIVRVESGAPQYLAVGDQMNGYRVESIDRGRVVMANADRSLSLAVANPSPTGPATQGNRGNNNRNQPQRPGQGGADNVVRGQGGQGGVGGAVGGNQTEAARAMMQMVEGIGARLQNATPEQRAALLRELQAAGAQLGGNVGIQIQGDRVMIRQGQGGSVAGEQPVQRGGFGGQRGAGGGQQQRQ